MRGKVQTKAEGMPKVTDACPVVSERLCETLQTDCTRNPSYRLLLLCLYVVQCLT